MKSIFSTIFAIIRFAAFAAAVILQLPILFLLPTGGLSIGYSRIFWLILMKISGIRIRIHGELSPARPLMIVANHISILEFAVFPIAFGAGMIGKDDIRKMPLVGWIARKIGVIFISRDQSRAAAATQKIADAIMRVKYPMLIFPEGTTTSGTYVLPFKSAMFSFAENNERLAIQPVAMHYRDRRGRKIPDQVMADDYGYFDNCKMTRPPYCKRERSAFGQLFHIMKLGGCTIELSILPPPPLAGKNRKEIAATLHEIISDEFIRNK